MDDIHQLTLEDIVAELEQQLTKDLLARIVSYAAYQLMSDHVKYLRDGQIPNAQDAEALVLSVIEAILKGSRKWHPDKYDLFFYLKLSVDCRIKNYIRDYGRKALSVFDPSSIDPEIEDVVQENLFIDEETPIDLLLSKEADERYISFVEHLADEPDLQRLAVLIGIDGISKRSELAKEVGCQPKKITNLRKQMERRLVAYWPECKMSDASRVRRSRADE